MPKPDVTVPLRVQDLLDHLSHEVEIVTYGPAITTRSTWRWSVWTAPPSSPTLTCNHHPFTAVNDPTSCRTP